MPQQALWRLDVLTVWFIGAVSVADAVSEVAGTNPQPFPGAGFFLA